MKHVSAIFTALYLGSLLAAQVPAPSTLPDQRFKVDLLLVVAHPDDESEIGAFLAKVVFDEHKRVAVVYGTRGNGGGNAIGQEQAAALGAIREIEGRRALGFLGSATFGFWMGRTRRAKTCCAALKRGTTAGRLATGANCTANAARCNCHVAARLHGWRKSWRPPGRRRFGDGSVRHSGRSDAVSGTGDAAARGNGHFQFD